MSEKIEIGIFQHMKLENNPKYNNFQLTIGYLQSPREARRYQPWSGYLPGFSFSNSIDINNSIHISGLILVLL